MAPPPLGVPMKPPVRAVIMPWTPDDRKVSQPTQVQLRRIGTPARYAVPRSWYNGRRGLSHKQLVKWLGKEQLAQTPGAVSQWLGPMVFTPHEEGILASVGQQPLAVVRPDGSYRIETDASSGFHRQDPDGMKFALNALTGAGFNIKNRRLMLAGKPLEKGMEVRPPDRGIADWWNKSVDMNDQPNHNAALPFADYLQERGDWRHHILTHLATVDRMNGRWTRQDGIGHETSPTERNPYVTYGMDAVTYEQREQWLRDRHFPANGWVRYGVDPHTRKPTILVRTGFNLRGEPKSNKTGFAVFTPEEFHAMRQDAAAAGHPIPEPPPSHRPQQGEAPVQHRRKFNRRKIVIT